MAGIAAAFSGRLRKRLDATALAAAAGFTELDPWQRDLLQRPSKRQLLLCSRQSGKSTALAVLGLHRALYWDKSLVLMVSPSLRQSAELFLKCIAIYRALGRPVAADAENALSLKLNNGSRIVSLPSSEGTIRGYSGVNLLLVDEAARVPDELHQAVRPMLAVSNGTEIAASTPFGRRGWFWEAWSNAEGWEHVEIPATACPRISSEFLEEERRSMAQAVFEAEYLCRFNDASGSFFRMEDFDRSVTEDEPWFIPSMQWEAS